MPAFVEGDRGGWRGRSPGEKGGGKGVQEVEVEGAESWMSQVVGSGRNREKLCNIVQYFAIVTTEKCKKAGANKNREGNWD